MKLSVKSIRALDKEPPESGSCTSTPHILSFDAEFANTGHITCNSAM